jgi:hypothetical protein
MQKKTTKAPSTNRQEGGSHYQLPIQPIEYIYKNKLGYMEGNVIKYVTRHADKGGAEDLRKAIHYLEMLLEWRYGK